MALQWRAASRSTPLTRSMRDSRVATRSSRTFAAADPQEPSANGEIMDGNEHNAAQRDLPYEMLKLQSIEEKVGEQPPDLPAPAGHEASRSEESPPLADYDRLNATQVEKRLDRMSPEQLQRVEDYEQRHKHRRRVINRVERRLSRAR